MDDDNYVNARALLKLLKAFPQTLDVYVGRPSLNRPIHASEPQPHNRTVGPSLAPSGLATWAVGFGAGPGCGPGCGRGGGFSGSRAGFTSGPLWNGETAILPGKWRDSQGRASVTGERWLVLATQRARG